MGGERGREGGREEERGKGRSDEKTSELQSRPHIWYAVFGLKKKNINSN